MWPCFKKVMYDPDVNVKDRLAYLSSIFFNHQLQVDSTKMDQQIMKLIESPLSRYEGLVLWYVSLKNSQIFLSSWGKILVGILQSKCPLASKQISLFILKEMVQLFGTNTKFAGTFHKYLPEILPCLLSDTQCNQGFTETCSSLTLCMNVHPEVLGVYSTEIEKFLLQNLDTECVQTMEVLSDCFAVLPSCVVYHSRPKSSYMVAWEHTFDKTVKTIHALIDDFKLFQPGPSYEDHEIFDIPNKLSEDTLSFMYNRIRTLTTLCRCLAKLLSSKDGSVKASEEEVLILVKRMLSLNEEAFNQPDENMLFFLKYPKVLSSAFMILEALVLNFAVVEQVDGIMSLVNMALDMSQSSIYLRPFCRQIRWSVWKLLKSWIHASGCKVTNEIASDEIIDLFLQEISIPETDTENITVDSFQKLSCIEALRAFNALLTSGSCFLKKETLETASMGIVNAVRNLRPYLNAFKQFPHPYDDEDCRFELYDLLLTCSFNGHPYQCQSTLSRAVNLFRMAVKDPSLKVRQVCYRSFTYSSLCLHPSKPLPENVQPMVTTDELNATTNQVKSGEENYLDDWEMDYRHESSNVQNGYGNLDESLQKPAAYSVERAFSEAVEDSGLSQEHKLSESAYIEMPHHAYKKTSQHSSQSDGGDDSEYEEGMEEDKESSFDEEDSPKKTNEPIYIQEESKGKPTIQLLSAQNNANTHLSTEECSSDVNLVTDKDASCDEEPPMVENGIDEEDAEEEEDEEDDDEELSRGEVEDRFSPEVEDRPIKKRKLDEESDEKVESNSKKLSSEDEEAAAYTEPEDLHENDIVDHTEAVAEVTVNGNENIMESGSSTPDFDVVMSKFVPEVSEAMLLEADAS